MCFYNKFNLKEQTNEVLYFFLELLQLREKLKQISKILL